MSRFNRFLAVFLFLAAVLAILTAPTVTHATGGIFISTPDVYVQMSATQATYIVDRSSNLVTLQVSQRLTYRDEYLSGVWLVPVAGDITNAEFGIGTTFSGSTTTLYPPNPCEDLVPYNPPGGPSPYTRSLDPAEVLGDFSIVSGDDIVAWAADHDLDLAAALAPYATSDWSFFAVPWSAETPIGDQYGEGFRGFVLPLEAIITYQAGDANLTVPVGVLTAPTQSSFNELALNIVSDTLYAPQNAEQVAILTDGAQVYNQINWGQYVRSVAGFPFNTFDRQVARTYEMYMDAFVQTYAGPTNDGLQVARYRATVTADDAVQNYVFAPAPDMPPYTTFDLTVVDPLQLYQCSTRSIGVIGTDDVLENLPPQRNYIPEYDLTVFTPDGWVRSDVVFQGEPIIVVAEIPVGVDEVAAVDETSASDEAMLLIYNWTPDSGLNFSPRGIGFNRVVPGPTGDSFPRLSSSYALIEFPPTTEDDDEQAYLFAAVLDAIPLRLYSAHPDLRYTVYIKPDTDLQLDSALMSTLQLLTVGQPEGFIESIAYNPTTITYTHETTGDTITIALALADDCATAEPAMLTGADQRGYAGQDGIIRYEISTTSSASTDDVLLNIAQSFDAVDSVCDEGE